MNKIYVATKLRAEDCDGSYVSVLAVGSFEDCKKAVRSAWEKVAKHEDIGDFDEKATSEWSCYIQDSVSYTLTFNIHCVRSETMTKSTKTTKFNRQRKSAVKPKKYNAIEITSNETNGDNDSDVICTGSYDKCLDAIEKAFKDMGTSDECDLPVNSFDRDDEETWVHYSCDGNEGEVVTTWQIKAAK